MYWAVILAIGMSVISICCRRIRSSRRSRGPSKASKWKVNGDDTVLQNSTRPPPGRAKTGPARLAGGAHYFADPFYLAAPERKPLNSIHMVTFLGLPKRAALLQEQ